MKKTIVCTLFLAALCLPIFADVITPSQALAIAEDFLSESLSTQHAQGMRGIAKAADEEPAPLYIISRGDNLGWVIVSGDDCLPAVIGYCDSGNFDTNDMSPAYRDMLNCVTAAVTSAQEAGNNTRHQPVTATERKTISPLLTSHWNQGAPWNLRCPICSDNGEHAVVGCVATAASQVIYYFRKDLPNTLQASTPTYKGGDEQCDVTEVLKKGTPIQYELMFDSYTNSEPEEFKMAVATLCYGIGAAAKLGYWHSTGGYISEANKAMRTHFGLGGTALDRNEMALSEWEDIIYKSLEKKKPLLYSGFTTDGKSGHAINIDGYNATNGLWHFNFGWGGGGDGWYTLDLETGVNGFCIWQSIVHDITPTKQSLSGSLDCSDILYRRVSNTLKASITNNSTIGAKGFNIYLMTADKNPSSSNTAIDTESSTWIEPGETAEITFKVRPSLTRDYYAYLTDSQRNVLYHKKVTVVDAEPAFTLNAFDANTSDDIITEGGVNFRVLYNSAATLSADISNSTNGTPGQPSVQFELYKWDPATSKDTLSFHKTVSTISFEKGERQMLTSTFKNLKEDTYYIGRIQCNAIDINTPDSLVRFVVKSATLALDTIADGVAYLSGGWDEARFAQLAKDPSVCAYDLTNVTGITANVASANAVNPNALYYVKGQVQGRNIIDEEGQCASLVLTTGYDFRPLAPFHAAQATFTADYAPAVWNTLTLPFECQRPEGWLCRKVTAFSASYVKEAVTPDTLQASRTYIVMADSRTALPFTASDVEVMATVDTTLMTPFIGTFHSIKTYPLMHEGDSYILSLDTDPESTTQYFTKTDTTHILQPFQSVLSSTSKKIRSSANNTLETAYKKLATAINEAQALYDDKHTQITDSANQAMEALLAEAHDMFYQMVEETAANVSSMAKELTAICTTYPLMLKNITKPIDYSTYITNPSFETNNKTGWKTDAYATVKPLTNISTFGAYADGKYLLYNSKANASTAISQTATQLPDGYYRASVMLGTAEGGVVTFFAGKQEMEMPASDLGKYYLTEAVIDSIRVEGGELTIGIRAGNTWYKADNFQLHYIGRLYNDDTAVRSQMMDADLRVCNDDNAIYDLTGRRLASPSDMLPGVLYIRNGCKIMFTQYPD